MLFIQALKRQDMIISKINSRKNSDNIEIDISISKLKEKLNNFECVIVKNCLDKNNLLEIKKKSNLLNCLVGLDCTVIHLLLLQELF